ncbi:hypothetical protein D049_1691A, partial [Vibrio parahaemolyticus VPTS-2010]
MRPNP